MSDNHFKQFYDDGNIPQIDLPQNNEPASNFLKAGTYLESPHSSAKDTVEPLPESFRPRKDGPGGE